MKRIIKAMTDQPNNRNRKPLRVAVLGAGLHSRYCHGPALCALTGDGVSLVAVCDLDEDRAREYARDFGFARVYTDLDVMLATEQLDGLIAVTPLALTASIGAHLLSTGIPVLLEKPPGRDTAEAQSLVDVAARYHAPHMLSFNRRFHPAMLAARQWLEAGGHSPQVMVARMVRVQRDEPDFVQGTGIHLIDAVSALLGSPTHVSASHAQARAGNGTFTQAVITHTSGCRAHLIFSPMAGSGEETYEIHGGGFTLLVDTVQCTATAWEQGEVSLHWHVSDNASSAYRDGTIAETAAFIAALKGERAFSPTLYDGLLAMQTASAIMRGGETALSPVLETRGAMRCP